MFFGRTIKRVIGDHYRRLAPTLKKRLGGAGRDRTDDLKLAKLALSQLSYGPIERTERLHEAYPIVVGLDRLELSTSRLSGVRSNHLSYRPEGRVRSSKKDQEAHQPYADEHLIHEKEKRRRRHPALSLMRLHGKADYLSH